MSEPEIEYLRKSLDELREKMHERDHDSAKEIGYTRGWQEMMGVRIDRIEQRLDTLLFSLLDERRHKAKDGKRPGPKVSRRPDVSVPSGGDGSA
jgi:hypothetical protein